MSQASPYAHMTDDEKAAKIDKLCDRLREPNVTEEECHEIVDEVYKLKGFTIR